MAKSQASMIQEYLGLREKTARLKHLTAMRAVAQHLPISLTEDLLRLDLGIDEKQALLETTHSTDPLAYEHFLTESLLTWPQELSTTALRLWSQRTEHLLWFRLVELCKSPLVPQRVRYTVLDNCFHAGGLKLVQTIAAIDGIEDMSPAFQSLILIRAVQWNFEHPRLTAMSRAISTSLHKELHPETKSLPAALVYLARFAPADFNELMGHGNIAIAWRDLVRMIEQSIHGESETLFALGKLMQKLPKTKVVVRLEDAWPPLWQRHALSSELIASALKIISTASLEDADTKKPSTSVNSVNDAQTWELFAGAAPAVLLGAALSLEDDTTFTTALGLVDGLLPYPTDAKLLAHVKERLAKTSDPGALLAALPLSLRLEITDTSSGVFSRLKQEETATLSGKTPTPQIFSDTATNEDQQNPHEMQARKSFFDLAYRQSAAASTTVAGTKKKSAPSPATGQQDLWTILTDAWNVPSNDKLASLANFSRQITGVYRLCYLNTLGRFNGLDEAALKLLDFTRSKEEDDIRAVIHAFGGIGTARAAQELISALTRPNITSDLQMEICTVLKRLDVSHLQKELHSAINDLVVEDKTADSNFEVREAIAALLMTTADATVAYDSSKNNKKGAVSTTINAVTAGNNASVTSAANDQQLDQILGQKIPHYRELSSEVKRALRTSLFFHMQVTAGGAPGSIDLSPVIDMQYKALELLFRESFEEACSQVIQSGNLQRRLDVLGYARPIPHAMDEFESYIASLPIVRDIPFFSKFKLRKMLRAICQFRPGKRFTLDGLKAFSLFFLCFSRQECRYGLVLNMPLGFAKDTELFEFCKEMHILQDFRNRAAHEGFHPDASNDIDGIWRSTASIIQTMYKVKNFLDSTDSRNTSSYAPRQVSQPIIEKKVS